MPKKPLNLLKGILSGSDSEVLIEYNESNAKFSFDDTTLICRLIDGKYPNYEAVIPKENPNKLIIDNSITTAHMTLSPFVLCSKFCIVSGIYNHSDLTASLNCRPRSS